MARNNRNDEESRALSTEVLPPRLPYPAQAQAAGIGPGKWKALVDAVFPSAKTVDGVFLALEYAHARNLDVFKRVVHVVPMWNSALGREVETVWPGIGELRTTAHRTGKMAGVDDCVFGPDKNEAFKDARERTKSDGRGGRQKVVDREECEAFTFPEWAQVTVYRMVDGERCAFVGPKVRFKEFFSGVKGLRVPNARWQQAPYYMLEKCAEAAALRRAFPEELGDVPSAEEMEGKTMDDLVDVDFVVVPETEERQRDPRPERGQKTADEPKWGDDVAATLKSIQKKVDMTHNADDLRAGKTATLAGTAKGWNADARKECSRIFDDRIAFLEAEKPAGAGADDDDQSTGEPDYAGYVSRYIDNLGQRIGNAPDLNSYRSQEKATVDKHLPEPWKSRAEKAFEIAMAVTKEGGSSEDFRQRVAAMSDSDAGETAAADDDQPSGQGKAENVEAETDQ